MNKKTCTKCGETFPATAEYFYRREHHSPKYRLRPQCKNCMYAAKLAWNNKNEERVKEYSKKSTKRRKEFSSPAIYKITNNKTSKIYIGQSTMVDIRWYSHKLDLRNNKHHVPQLQEDYDKYGMEAFVFEVIEELPCDTSRDVLLEKESEAIKKYLNEGKRLYNKKGA